MSRLARVLTLALANIALVASAHAATFVVTAKTQSFDTQLARKIEAVGGTITARLPQIGVAFVQSDYSDFGARAGSIDGVRSAVVDIDIQFDQPESDYTIKADYANPPNSGDNDALFDLQWGHAAIDAAGAWNQDYRGAGVKVAVLDSGVYCDHVDIAPNLLAADSISFVHGEDWCNTLFPQNPHGTHVAGTILAADNGIGTIGVAPQAKLIAVKVLGAETGSGSFETIIRGIVHAADKGADVINMSLGVRGGLLVNGQGANEVRELMNAVKRAIQYARSQNATVVVSAGNDAQDLDHNSHEICNDDIGLCSIGNHKAFPAELPGVVSVSALGPVAWAYDFNTNLDRLASYSNYGQSAITFGAPGGDFAYSGFEDCTVQGVTTDCFIFDMVLSTTFSPDFYSWNAGTSMAAPHVSGVAALIIGKHGGEMAPAEVERILRASSDDLGKPGKDDAYGYGRVNASRAVGL